MKEESPDLKTDFFVLFILDLPLPKLHSAKASCSMAATRRHNNNESQYSYCIRFVPSSV